MNEQLIDDEFEMNKCVDFEGDLKEMEEEVREQNCLEINQGFDREREINEIKMNIEEEKKRGSQSKYQKKASSELHADRFVSKISEMKKKK